MKFCKGPFDVIKKYLKIKCIHHICILLQITIVFILFTLIVRSKLAAIALFTSELFIKLLEWFVIVNLHIFDDCSDKGGDGHN